MSKGDAPLSKKYSNEYDTYCMVHVQYGRA